MEDEDDLLGGRVSLGDARLKNCKKEKAESRIQSDQLLEESMASIYMSRGDVLKGVESTILSS